MRRTINISVTEEMYEFIQRRVSKSAFYSVSSYIRSLIREDDVLTAQQSTPIRKEPKVLTLNEMIEAASKGCPACGRSSDL